MDRPNLVFVMTDHQRADSIGMVQGGVEVTPALNRFAERAARFDRAYTTCPLCVPARTALATGLYPTRNGVVFNDWAGTRAGDHVPIHQMLADAGYAVAHIGVDHIRLDPGLRDRLPGATWFSEGDHATLLEDAGVVCPYTEKERLAFSRPCTERRETGCVDARYSSQASAPWWGPDELFKDTVFCDRAIEWLEGRDGPFALFLYLWAPHPPLWAPEAYLHLFDPDALDLPADVNAVPESEPPRRRLGVPAQIAEGLDMDAWRRAWAAHLGLVRLADDGIGRVLETLESTGAAGDTVTLFTTDHGDHMGQRRMYQKMELYAPAVRIPLLLSAPGGAGGRYRAPVSHLDVVPTLLDLLDLPAPAALDGISLAPTVAEGAPPPPHPIFMQYSGNPEVGDIRRGVVDGTWKYVYDPHDAAKLYDLAEDPLEQTNLAAAPEHAERRARMHGLLRDWHAARGDWVEYA